MSKDQKKTKECECENCGNGGKNPEVLTIRLLVTEKNEKAAIKLFEDDAFTYSLSQILSEKQPKKICINLGVIKSISH